MNKWHLLFFLHTFVATAQNNQIISIVKCCDFDQQLDENLNCNSFSRVLSTNNINYRNSTENPLLSTTMSIEEFKLQTNHRYEVDRKWLANNLNISYGDNGLLMYGWDRNCTLEQTLWLEITPKQRDFYWLPDGLLAVRFPTAHGDIDDKVFFPGEYCVDSFKDSKERQGHVVLLCPCKKVQCIKKCCPWHHALVCNDSNVCDCQPLSGNETVQWTPFHPKIHRPVNNFPFEVVIDRNVTCNESYEALVDTYPGYPIFLLQRFWKDLWEDNLSCGDIVVHFESTPKHGLIRCNREVPFRGAEELADAVHVPEALFLLLAVATTALAPRRRLSPYSYVHDMALMWHGASLLARSALWTAFLAAWWLCGPLPIIIYFFSVAASFWLNVLCINMTCGFWKPLGLQRGLWNGGRVMMFLYSLYAWGGAAALTAFAAAMWFAPWVPPWMLRPTLHETKSCFREEEGDGKVATLAYFYGPVGALLVVNALLFSSTALRVRQLRRSQSMLGNRAARGKAGFNADRSVVIYIKLMWLMGVMEMAVEMVAWVWNKNEYYFWLATSFLDVLRAAAIFFLCCCKWRTLRALRDRLCGCAALRRWRGEQSMEETELPTVSGKFSKTASDISLRTNVTICELSSANNES